MYCRGVLFAAKKEETRRQDEKQRRDKKLMDDGTVYNRTIKLCRNSVKLFQVLTSLLDRGYM